MEILKIQDLVENDVFSLKPEEKLVAIKEYMKRFGNATGNATCPIHFSTGTVCNNIGLDEDVITLIGTLDDSLKNEAFDVLWYRPYLFGESNYTLRLKTLSEMNMSSELIMYVVNSFSRDTMIFRELTEEQITLMLGMISSLPKDMQLKAFRIFRNNEIIFCVNGKPNAYCLLDDLNSHECEIKPEFVELICDWHNMLTADELIEGIEKIYYVPYKMGYAASLVRNILNSESNPTTVSLLCEKYRLEALDKVAFSFRQDRRLLISSYLDLVTLDPNPEYGWLQKIADVKRMSDEVPYQFGYCCADLLENKFLVPLRENLVANGMEKEQLDITIDLLVDQINEPDASIDYEGLGLTKYFSDDSDTVSVSTDLYRVGNCPVFIKA